MKENFLPALTIVAVVAVVGLIVFGLGIKNDAPSEVVREYYGLAAGGVKPDKVNNNDHVWDVLQRQGLQGDHYTLNIHGKKDSFNKQDCNAIDSEYGNNIFIPSNSPESNNQILMLSGNAKGKWASEAVTTFGVRDSCVAAFDGDAAELVIPPNDQGYFVVARVLGKPTNDPELTLGGDLVFVQDELGNDLLVLGMVTDNGFQTPTTTLTRTKGKVKAVDITGLFEWNGQVCYFDGTNYCYDEFGSYTCSAETLCCQDTGGDGIFDTCTDPMLDIDGLEYCADGYSLMDVACQEYVNEWVFNIGDLVGYMWDEYSDGDFKLANIRFYPIK